MPLVLYSTNAYIAYMINQRYCKGLHYVWCSEVFDARVQYGYGPHASIPPSSSPWEIYKVMREDARRGDRHSASTAQLKKNIRDGAGVKLNAEEITQAQFKEITEILDQASAMDFRPLLYIIPYQSVATLVQEVPIAERAHPLSLELRIAAWPRNLFDVIEVNYE